MEIRKMKLSELTPAEYNPRVELKPGDQEWEALDESIDNFGYVEPIVWNGRTAWSAATRGSPWKQPSDMRRSMSAS